MAILNQTQLVAASNATYIDNTSGSITPTAVRTLNNDWISSSILAPVTSSMTVASASFAGTASFALNFNPSATASYALQALNSTNAVSASYALQATNANNASLADQATFANTAGTANSAVTASFALNFNPAATASYALFAATASNVISASFANTSVTASFALNFNPSATASYALFAETASNATNAVSASRATSALNADTASFVTLAQTASYVVNAISASLAATASFVVLAQTASYVLNAVSSSRATSAANADTASFVTTAQTASYVVNAISASYASNAELLDNLNFTAFVLTSSFVPFSSSVSDRFNAVPTLAGNNTFTGTNNFNVVSASYIQALSASIDYLSVIYQTSSVVYSSGSNIFGDAANDVQTLFGTVDIKTGPLLVSGSTFISSSLNVIGTTSNLGDLSVTGSLSVSGSTILRPRYVATEQPFTINQVPDATSAGANILSTRNTTTTSTGSVTVSGSNNILLLNLGAPNGGIVGGTLYGFNGRANIVSSPNISISGSNTVRTFSTVNSSIVNSSVTVIDNRIGETSTPLTLTSANIGAVTSLTTSTGSSTLNNVFTLGTTSLAITGSNGATKTFGATIFNGATNAIAIDSPSTTAITNGVLVSGNVNSLLSSGSNVTFQGTSVLGYALVATGSAAATTNYGTVIAGRWNASDNTSVVGQTAFAVGTGTAAGSRRTSFFVSASGLTTVRNGIEITGSVNGFVTSASIASNTASLDFSQGNFYTSLVTGTTNFNITNPEPGQTVNLLLTTAGTGASASFSSNVKQVSGSLYTPTPTNGAQDILTFISFDGASVYLASVKNLI